MAGGKIDLNAVSAMPADVDHIQKLTDEVKHYKRIDSRDIPRPTPKNHWRSHRSRQPVLRIPDLVFQRCPSPFVSQMFPPPHAQHVHSPPGFHVVTIAIITHAWAMPYLMQICPKNLEQTKPQPKDPLDAPAHLRTSVLHIRHHPTCTNHFSSWQPKEKQKKIESPTNINPPNVMARGPK